MITDKAGLKALSVGAWHRPMSRMSGLKQEPFTAKLASKRSAEENLASSSVSFLMQHPRSLPSCVFVYRQKEEDKFNSTCVGKKPNEVFILFLCSLPL